MRSVDGLKRSGRWTSYVSRQCNRMRRELVKELGAEPEGRKLFFLDSFVSKYGVYQVLLREVKRRALVSDQGDLMGMLDKNFLAWQHSLSRDLALLFADSPEKENFEGLIQNANA